MRIIVSFACKTSTFSTLKYKSYKIEQTLSEVLTNNNVC